MVSVKNQDLFDPRWYISCRYEDKVPTYTGLVGDGFDTMG